ncbi:monooxygenase [Afipia sp. P52-10]|uniref:FAD-dependent monooxygenase n=1 Tax=Afipia sp. P52-10 TaxID=1429916 RepID=UPI0003DF012C|nr:FAD-dependent monooxygenase [Afipia sp. P52-10]ETR75695.1 monooxygenase [Afipia sp. P52-10]
MCAKGQGSLTPATTAQTRARRAVAVAGAGIGGLTAALTLAEKRFHVVLHEKAEALEEAGAGIQLSPNATRILIGLGLEQEVAARAVTPDGISIRNARSGREIVRIPLGAFAQAHYGAPYWIVHRADLQAALLAHVRAHPDIDLRLGSAYSDSIHPGMPLIGADGVWSRVRQQLFGGPPATFSGHVAWRGTLDAAALPRDIAPGSIALWLGQAAHLVVYPVRSGTLVNVVAIVEGQWEQQGWNAPGEAAEIAAAFDPRRWSGAARDLIGAIETWRKWALFSVSHTQWARGDVALIGDAAHAMLPFAAQGAAMAIEDAAVLADCLGQSPDDASGAFQRYALLRRSRIALVKRTTWQSGLIYHLPPPVSLARNLVMTLLGGERLLAQRDAIYRWRLTP